ncbi:hypothetical protein [Tardiphaga sp.]|uniref:hypothetical protein n=1 Tax=Tardiphaga sp. TaxID=1926292 RepID=UPI00261DA907|nr:hypothetical protein [Tardiphaga sp.]MDB5620859.1 hypothetical protein [Tardiphaga sp.]
MKIEMDDTSAQVFGKYQYCTKAKDGMWYADSDFGSGDGCGPLKRGALPSPRQDTSELTARAKAIHKASARKATTSVLNWAGSWSRPFNWPSLWLGFGIGSVLYLIYAISNS